MRLPLSIALAATLTVGLLERGASADVQSNSPEFNGLSFNGLSFNGLSFNGLSFNGLSFNGGLLTGTVAGLTVDALDMIGAVIEGTTTDGDPVTLRIDDVVPDPIQEDIYHFWVSIELDGEWVPICEGRTPALAIPGEWMACEGPGCGGRGPNADAFTFACQGSSIAKCAENLGYKPWLEVPTCTSSSHQKFGSSTCMAWTAADYHEACVRMLRGDYCGNGMPTTKEGTAIMVWDELPEPIQVADESVDWPLEAEWNPFGATCVSHVRWDTALDDDVLDTYGLPPKSTVADYVAQVCEPSPTYTSKLRRCGEVGSRSGIGTEMLLANDSELLKYQEQGDKI